MVLGWKTSLMVVSWTTMNLLLLILVVVAVVVVLKMILFAKVDNMMMLLGHLMLFLRKLELVNLAALSSKN